MAGSDTPSDSTPVNDNPPPGPPKPQNPTSRNEPLQNIAGGPTVPERGLTRSPQLSSLPENGVPNHNAVQLPSTIADFALPVRQDTDSTTSTSEASYMLRSNRSSIVPQHLQTSHPLNSSENQLQAARQSIQLQALFENLKVSLKDVPTPHKDQIPRLPKDEDLSEIQEVKHGLSWKIRHYNGETHPGSTANIVLVLHDDGGDETALKPLAKKHLAHPETAFLFLGGITRIRSKSSGQVQGLQWADDLDGNTYQRATRLVLEYVVCRVLISKCNFAPKDIAFIGQGQGGTVALTIASVWDTTRLGGIITIDGPPPEYIACPQTPRNPTPVLVLGGKLGVINPEAEQRIRDMFLFVDTGLQSGVRKLQLNPSVSSEETQLAQDFLAHSLRQEEWKTQAVLAFDGGGIRGYGSLLIMKELMRRVGAEERRLDSMVKSSFGPGIYKPRAGETIDGRPGTASSHPRPIVPSSLEGLDDGDLFLPCHYFTYVGGTSTGGLISIMLSRFRMSVNDCIMEYKTLGGKVFAHPRQLSKGGILWHKFSWKNLNDAIQDVTNRHCFDERSFGVRFPSDPDFCRTVVLAYSENGTADAPYLFRTYETFRRPREGNPPQPGIMRKRSTVPIHNPGASSDVEIPLVGRATSAAPTYFPPVRIAITDRDGRKEVRFKDGGFGSNNPSPEVYRDVVHKHGGFSKAVSVFVVQQGSFGQEGWTRAATRIREAYATLKAAMRLPVRTKGAHNAMTEYAHHDNKKVFQYSRFDGGPRLGTVKMDEWKSNRLANMMTLKHTISGAKTLHDMEDAVAVYLADPQVQDELDECARILVHRRRLRIRDRSRWDRFASASWYECPFLGCEDSAELKTYTAFEDHVRKEHPREYASVESFDGLAENNRRCWLYRNG
ncbi:acyl transferase/acyl hydrolase/lysophospholipase [Leptodontidium sp. MPI-SDFR-AT-0119]|nr:acyl transferase/acyl hydrolase/lysophospholipase [Leptodontidium sp. MPI-SDFR-AT-0119]